MKDKNWKGMRGGAGSGAVYGLGFVGALVYYLGNATTFGQGIFGIIKAIVWPAILIFKVFELLKI